MTYEKLEIHETSWAIAGWSALSIFVYKEGHILLNSLWTFVTSKIQPSIWSSSGLLQKLSSLTTDL